MTRYELTHRSRGMDVHTDIEENPLGDYVKFADVEAWQAKLLAMLAFIVVTEGRNSGVVMLSGDSPTHGEDMLGRIIQVYDHDYFSPLGDALIALRDAIKEIPPAGA